MICLFSQITAWFIRLYVVKVWSSQHLSVATFDWLTIFLGVTIYSVVLVISNILFWGDLDSKQWFRALILTETWILLLMVTLYLTLPFLGRIEFVGLFLQVGLIMAAGSCAGLFHRYVLTDKTKGRMSWAVPFGLGWLLACLMDIFILLLVFPIQS